MQRKRSPQFHVFLSPGPSILFYYMTVDIMFLFAVFTEGTGNIFRRFGDSCHI
jgi:hypothetical protein